MSKNPRDIIIAGTAYSGSTLLSNVLNGHPEISTLGELNNLSIWKNYKAVESVPLCSLCDSQKITCKLWNEKTLDELRGMNSWEVSGYLRRKHGLKHLVDSSKLFSWLQYRMGEKADKSNLRVLLACRLPMAYAVSNQRRVGASINKSIAAWLRCYNYLQWFLQREGIPYLAVRCEDFVCYPTWQLSRICQFLGVPYSESMLNYWETEVHAIGGNASGFIRYSNYSENCLTEEDRKTFEFYRGKKLGGRNDQKWRTELSRFSQLRILAKPRVLGTMENLGYSPLATFGGEVLPTFGSLYNFVVRSFRPTMARWWGKAQALLNFRRIQSQ